ncbi:hypothetical protein [Azotobacter beijerinckii]|uniref:Uncharacterized protein n=1 Tax=Azotobacter beijerinckii TaxID=170623 RepID=A0A1I3Z3R9_9GAMM|nr:hypothetical protein [Azotobacter beijerinckii]SFA72834.1 hypothetical protein SAMN04244571_00148 [Azotobacter beijerinckii]SFK38734.1 hypothetical protein SAMN04244574_00431 [Azotobacter beijerinckii]
MPNKIGYVDNANGQLAHYNLLAAIRLFCGGFGVLGTLGGTRTGTGTLAGLEASPASVTETRTLTCAAAAANGGTFSVVGSVSGAKANATVGAAYDNGLLKFTLADGATDFVVGDVVLNWAHRDRLLQADQLIDTAQGSIGPESCTTYSARLLRADTQAVLASQAGIAGTTATLATTYVGSVIAKLRSVRDGLDSHQRWRHTFAHAI